MSAVRRHALVKHSLNEYVRGDVTTNRIEGAFGHFKRAVHGVYHKVSDEHLDRYVQCFAWRWNRRKMGEGERVNELLKATKGKRITTSGLPIRTRYRRAYGAQKNPPKRVFYSDQLPLNSL